MGKEKSSKCRRVLNVGGHSKNIAIPSHYDGWDHLLLDIDAKQDPDIVCDARQLDTLEARSFDAVYCSHNLEHYYRHDVSRVLNGFRHVLKDDGFCEIQVPDLQQVMRVTVDNNLDIDDVLYQSPGGPILVRDVIYGWGKQVEESGDDFFAHKTGFTQKSLIRVLNEAGFSIVYAGSEKLEVRAIAFTKTPTPYQLQQIGLAPPPGR